MKNLRIIVSILLLFAVLISCTGCFGYATRLPKNTYDKVSNVFFGVDGTEYVLAYKDSMEDFVEAIENTLDSGRIDVANGFGVFGKVKMPYGDSAVEYNKESYEIWFELLIENGKYKKLFFTMSKNDIQTIWIHATTTDSYDDGGFLEYYLCDCVELVNLATQYAKSIKGIDGATRIEATKYDMGKEIGSVTITEEESVKHIVDNLNSLKLKELKYNELTAIEYEMALMNYEERMHFLEQDSMEIMSQLETKADAKVYLRMIEEVKARQRMLEEEEKETVSNSRKVGSAVSTESYADQMNQGENKTASSFVVEVHDSPKIPEGFGSKGKKKKK